MTEMDKYAAEHLLGLSGTYNKDDFTRAYRAKVREYHPDLAASRGEDPIVAAEVMVHINKAKNYLEPLFDYKETITCSTTPSTPPKSSAAQSNTSSSASASAAKPAADTADNATSASQQTAADSSNVDTSAKSSYTSTYQDRNKDVPPEVMGYNPDGSWNMNPPWRYETNEEWEYYDPEPENYGRDGPYGGWGMNHPWGKAYFQGCQKEALWHAQQRKRAEAAREMDRKREEERERANRPDPVEQFRWHDGPMPDNLKKAYERAEHFPYRLLFMLVCFAFCLSYVYCDLSGLPIRDNDLYVVSTYVVFFVAIINLLTGLITNPIRNARFHRLDRKLAAWREQNAANNDEITTG